MSTAELPTVVMTSGVWDFCHSGHLRFLWACKQLGDILVVGVVRDDGVEAYKNRRPVWPEWQRLEKIKELPFVDQAEYQNTTDPTPLLERWRPDKFCHGTEPGWDRLLEGHETLERLGVEYALLSESLRIMSSTELREKRDELG